MTKIGIVHRQVTLVNIQNGANIFPNDNKVLLKCGSGIFQVSPEFSWVSLVILWRSKLGWVIFYVTPQKKSNGISSRDVANYSLTRKSSDDD